MKTAIAAVATVIVVAGTGLFTFGAYDISATDQHLAPTYWLMDTAMRRSVVARARRIEVPALDGAQQIERGGALFRDHCVQCHGAPGVAPEPFALGMTPAPANLVHTARAWKPAELFWTIKHGIKMTGMPAWAYRMTDDDVWATVAFLRLLPTLSPQSYATTVAGLPPGRVDARRVADAALSAPDPARGKRAIDQYLCITCHTIPGIVGSNAPVGPPLAGVGSRTVLAGLLPNTPENMVRWLLEPQAISPHNAMPALGLTEGDARDIAAYLRTLR